MRRIAIALTTALALTACGQEAEEPETPVMETEVAPASEADAETLGPDDRSLADEAEDSVTSPEGEATGKIQPID